MDSRDIHTVQPEEIPASRVDVVMVDFPCQSFSIASYRKEFDDDRGGLFFELLRIIEGVKLAKSHEDVKKHSWS